MSSTYIYAFDESGNAYLFASTHNAWRGGMAIWREMEERHLPPYYYRGNKSMPLTRAVAYSDESAMQEIWNLATNKDIPLHERIVLYTTFDNCLVKAENIPKVVDAFRKFGEDYTSLSEQADILEKLPKGTIAVGWNQTSVNCEDWSNFGGYDEENDEPIPYNCLTMNRHYWLFDELDTKNGEQAWENT